MNPIELSQQLQSTLLRYLLTVFDVNRDGQEPELADALEERLRRPRALFNGPFLELTPPYRTGRTLRQLCSEGVLSSALLDLPCFERGDPIPLDAPLFVHQEQAIRRLCVDRHGVVISSGTGSGKTEGFLIPILDDLLRDARPGVRALLIYPMNALVNDQLDRLRRLLKDTSITFGRYTSELETTERKALEKLRDPLPNEVICREQIWSGEKLPQILITNYAMLEYLLLRPEDSTLFQSGLWRFIVLDEAHTYSGAKGIEVAMLLRRLKHRLGKQPGETRCIATSATLTDDNVEAAEAFAENLFGEDYGLDDIIFGEVNRDFVPAQKSLTRPDVAVYTDPRLDELLDLVRSNSSDHIDEVARGMQALGLISEAQTRSGRPATTPAEFLYMVLQDNADLTRLRQWMLDRLDDPVPVEEAAEVLFGDLCEEMRLQALYSLIELGSMARPSPDKPPLLPARYHLFARSPQGVWVCLNPQCSGRESAEGAGWSRLFAERRKRCDACDCLVYPLAVCRECGQVYVQAYEHDNKLLPEAQGGYREPDARYFTWRPVVENRALRSYEQGDEDEADLPAERAAFEFPEKQLCVRCGRVSHCDCKEPMKLSVYGVYAVEHDRNRGVRAAAVPALTECPRCRSKAYSDTEIATPVSVGGSTPLSILAYELYRALPPSSKPEVHEKPGGGRKLLTFYDSRQGAARFAAFLQDVINTQNYRHIIPLAASELLSENDLWPDLISLGERSMELALDYQIFHNDPDSEQWRSDAQYLSGNERVRLRQQVQTQVFAEFTTRRRERQSLESLGLVGVSYHEEGREPDLGALATTLGLSLEQTATLVGYLLDDLRSKKLIALPRGVQPDDAVFGLNRFSQRLIREGVLGSQEQRWIGTTPRQWRRQYVQSVLRANGLPSDDDAVREALLGMWRWLIDIGLLVGRPSDGYQLDYSRLFFRTDSPWYRCERCQRLQYRGTSLPCPQPNCGGTLRRVADDAALRRNFFFATFDRPLIPMRAEEHTAQLDSEKGREYQEKFRDGDINVLSCSTTFEMGIDLGDLQAVVMSNVPPTVANYRQRSGRAGRRTSGTAFILTWSQDRPHDQLHFRAPGEIIRGKVRVPYITLDNSVILRRHFNAVLLSKFLRHLRDEGYNPKELDSAGKFFDQHLETPAHYSRLAPWLDDCSPDIRAEMYSFRPWLNDVADMPIDARIGAFVADLENVWVEHYQITAEYYYQEMESARTQQGDRRKAREREEKYEKLLKRFRDEKLINYLSDRGVLPSYSFPLHTVELMLPLDQRTEHLRLQRDLRDAIREFAPGSEVVADKRIWRSKSVVFFRDVVREREYRVCDVCGYLEISPEAGIPLDKNSGECPVCGEMPRRRSVRRYVEPDGFRADPKKSGQPAKQYVHVEPRVMRSALIPGGALEEFELSNHLYYSYDRDGKLLYVNEGPYGKEFNIPRFGGMADESSDKGAVRASLGHIQRTDTLHLRFVGGPGLTLPPPYDLSFWLSLVYALIQGASQALQVERRDIDGVLHPRRLETGWGQTIVLYDDVPGGAGYVRQIRDNMETVLHAAHHVVSCPDCGPETSCYRCLRDYNNQFYHPLLRRGQVLGFLDELLGG